MTEITLQFRYTNAPQRPACARFIPCAEPAAWLDELTRWGVPLDSLRLYPVPRSRSDNACLGVLVADAVRSDADAGSIRHVANAASVGGPATQPYGRVADRMYVPVEAALSLELSAAEWRGLLGNTRTEYVWHPQAGLVAFDPDEVLTVADLLSPQTLIEAVSRSSTDWGCARLGVTYPSRIKSLRAELPFSVTDMLTDGRDNIGTLAKPLDELPLPLGFRFQALAKTAGRMAWLPFAVLGNLLTRWFPPAPRVSHQTTSRRADTVTGVVVVAIVAIAIALAIQYGRATLLGLGAFLLALFAVFLLIVLLTVLGWLWDKFRRSGLSSRASNPAAASGAGGVGGGLFAALGAGVQRQVASLMRWTAGLLDARQREMDRLLRMLDEDPDEGLKYALPMAGDAARGIAPPSASLVSRSVDFQLGGAGSGGPADVWELPPDTQFQLIKRYRELAAREVQLGRYRRAAYIHAELLGDLNTAATTLVNGRFYREAAVLYRDKLNRPLDAAHCLEQGGLLLEAIPIYRQQGQIEKVGDLYRRLEDHEQADSAYREVVESTLARHDHLDAARLLQEKLDAPEEALAALDAGWPESPQARSCLKNSFTLLAKLGRHDDTVQRIRGLRQSPLSPHRAADAIEVLSSTAVNAPHAGSRTIAADAVRVMAARVLASGQVSRQQITAAVGRLAPEDLLLSRDCTRAAEKRPWEPNRPAEQPANAIPRNRQGTAQLIRTFALPAGVTWTATFRTDRDFYVAGRRGAEVILSRGRWDDPSESVTSVAWNTTLMGRTQVLIGGKSSDHKSALWVCATEEYNFPPRQFRQTDVAPDWEYAVSPGWMPRSVSAITQAPMGAIYTFQIMELLLTEYNASHQPTINQTLHIPLLDQTLDPHAAYPMVAQEGAVYLAVGRHLVESEANAVVQIRDMEQPIRGLAVSQAPAQTVRLVALLDDFGVYFGNAHLSNQHRFGIGLREPLAVFPTAGSRMVVHGHGRWIVYETYIDHLRPVRELPCEIEAEAFALLLTSEPGQVALCTTDGVVTVYEIP